MPTLEKALVPRDTANHSAHQDATRATHYPFSLPLKARKSLPACPFLFSARRLPNRRVTPGTLEKPFAPSRRNPCETTGRRAARPACVEASARRRLRTRKWRMIDKAKHHKNLEREIFIPRREGDGLKIRVEMWTKGEDAKEYETGEDERGRKVGRQDDDCSQYP